MSELPTPKDTRIAQVALTVSDVGRTRSFYEGQLGLPVRYELPNMLVLDAGGVSLLLSLPEDSVPLAPGGSVVYFEVPDIRSAVDRMRSRDVAFIDEPHVVHRTNDAALWMTFLRDPDGNLLALMSWQRDVTSAGT